MKIEELKIGNWLLFEGKPVCIEVLSHDGIVGIKDDANYEYEYAPILLTPILLEKCGFATEYTDDKDAYYTLRLSNDPYLTLSFLGAFDEKTKEFKVDLFPFNKAFTFSSLHQLQNAHYILTGTELQITL